MHTQVWERDSNDPNDLNYPDNLNDPKNDPLLFRTLMTLILAGLFI